MRGVQISYLIEHSEYVPQLAQWAFDQWNFIRGEKNAVTRLEELREHMNRDQLPVAWVAHGNGQLFGTAALRVDGPERREELTPWLSGVFVGSHFRRSGIRGRIMCSRGGRGSVARSTDSLSVHAGQTVVVFAPGMDNTWPVSLARAAR